MGYQYGASAVQSDSEKVHRLKDIEYKFFVKSIVPACALPRTVVQRNKDYGLRSPIILSHLP